MPELTYCRRRILEVLGSGELHLNALAEKLGRTATNVRRDLKLMAGDGLVVRRRDAHHVFYRAGGGPDA